MARTVIDLFAAPGGFSLGFIQAGFDVCLAIDNDPESAETYKRNLPEVAFIEADIKDLTVRSILKKIGQEPGYCSVVIGGPPCQGFSIAGHGKIDFLNDPRNRLFREFVRIVEGIQPAFFVMENVAKMASFGKGKVREDVSGSLRSIGYKVECKILDAADYGVPQFRRRVFFVGNRLGKPITFPLPSHSASANMTLFDTRLVPHVTVKEAIGDLPILENGAISTIPNHAAMKHGNNMLEKMLYVKDGGDRYDIPDHLRPESGDFRKYIRYNSKKPSVTVTGDMRKVFHYKQNRALTVRELARLQTFPDSFIFYGSRISQQQQVGNAVPPKLAKALALEILKYL